MTSQAVIVSVPHSEVEPSAWRRFLEKVEAAAHEELAAGTHVGLNDFGLVAAVDEAKELIAGALRLTCDFTQFLRKPVPTEEERDDALGYWKKAEAHMEQAEVALIDALNEIRDA